MRCPKCLEMLTIVDRNGIRARECPSCFGSFLAEIALKRMTRLQVTQQAPASQNDPASPAITDASNSGPSIAELAELVAESNSKERLRCPECTVEMTKNRVHPLIPVEIDTCPKCKSSWPDAGELALIQKLYFALQNSDDPKIVRLREKIAGINLDMANQRMQLADDVERAQRMAQNSVRFDPTDVASDVAALFRGLL